MFDVVFPSLYSLFLTNWLLSHRHPHNRCHHLKTRTCARIAPCVALFPRRVFIRFRLFGNLTIKMSGNTALLDESGRGKQREAVIRVAVIGSGLAGMSAAHILSQTEGVRVHMFERNPVLGMDAGSVPVPCECSACVADSDAETLDGQSQPSPPHVAGRIDVPMRSFFPGYYPYLTSLYDSLDIPHSQSDNSMSFFKLATPLEDPQAVFASPPSFPTKLDPLETSANKLDVNTNLPQPSYFSFSCWNLPYPINNFFGIPDLPPLSLLLEGRVRDYVQGVVGLVCVSRDYLLFLAYCVKQLDSGAIELAKRGEGPLANQTFGQVIKSLKLSDQFWSVFLPLFSGACTCTYDDLKAFPGHIILEYAAVCLPNDRMSFVTCGTKEVCARLSKPVQQVSFETTVVGLHHDPSTSQFTVTSVPTADAHTGNTTTRATTHRFDYVLFATQANQAARILRQTARGDYVERATRVLDRFPYTRSLVVVHTDTTLMPAPARASWRCMNFGVRGQHAQDPLAGGDGLQTRHEGGYDVGGVAMCTHYSQMTQRDVPGSVPPLFQTTNPIVMPDSATVISATWYERAIVRLDTVQALRELETLQGGGGGVYFVGSFVGDGIPLLESCVTSALNAARGIVKDAFGSEQRLYLPTGMMERVQKHEEKLRRRLQDGGSQGEKFQSFYIAFAGSIALLSLVLSLFIMYVF
ncbi:hypothetical protein BC830DRAFT_1100729 [Chytriomyces sp. MP71]|nr:hypothetical protein BC830DRAFT_1100729 [Chytriomyces sp. MP71]